MEDDELKSVRNYFYLGLSEGLAQEISAVKSGGNKELALGSEVYRNRHLLSSDPELVFKNVPQNAPTALQAVKLLGTYKTAPEDHKELVFETIKEWLSDESLSKDPTLQLLSAQVYFEDKNYKEALKFASQPPPKLEKLALQIAVYLKIDRVDLAAKTLKMMQDIDDDDTLTQLATSWVYISQGEEKVTEASFLLQELMEKFEVSIPVLNTLAVCQMQKKEWGAAFQFLKQARDLALSTKQKVSGDTLVNSIVCLQHLGKSPDPIIKELQTSHPNHPWLKRFNEMESLFDRHAATYKASR